MTEHAQPQTNGKIAVSSLTQSVTIGLMIGGAVWAVQDQRMRGLEDQIRAVETRSESRKSDMDTKLQIEMRGQNDKLAMQVQSIHERNDRLTTLNDQQQVNIECLLQRVAKLEAKP